MLIAIGCLANGAFAQHRSSSEGLGYGLLPVGKQLQIAADEARDSSRGGPPANDDCSNAQVIALTLNCFTLISGDNSAATSAGPDASCDDPGGTLLDVWYTFTTGAQGTVAITLSRSAGMTDGNYVLYEGACDGNEVGCRIAPVLGQQELLLPATQYWLRVYSNPAYGDPGAFTLCIQDVGAVPAPPNDDCANVTPSALAMGGSVTFTGDATYALNSEGLPFNSIWNAFTTTEAADVQVSLCATTASLGLIWLGLYTTCPADVENRVIAGSGTACANGLLTLCYGNLPAGTYYYAVNNGSTPGSYGVTVNATPAGSNSPANDDCAGAIVLTTSGFCSSTDFIAACATASPPSGGCLDGLANPEDDTWYVFTATSAQMTVGMLPHSLQYGPILEVYAGTCGALSSIGCSNGFSGDTLEVVLSSLVPGTAYYVKAYNGYVDFPLDDAAFGLCVVEGAGINIGIGENEAANDLLVFPNPNDGDFTVRLARGAVGAMVSVVDATGRMVMEERCSSGGPFTVNGLNRLKPGAYMVRIADGQRISQQRLVVQ